MHRRSIIIILIGIISSLAGFGTIDYFRAKRCTELSGKWMVASHQCELPSGELVGTGTPPIFLGGFLVAAALGFTCYRATLFASGRAKSIFAEK